VKLEGRARLPAPREQVWRLLNDPELLAQCLPGCQGLEPAGPDRYHAKIRVALAAISGNFSGSLELAEKKPPASLRLRLEGKGLPGFVKGEGRIELGEEKGSTEIRYAGEVQVGGMIAAVGERLMETTARKLIQQFFSTAAKLLAPPG
jgi:uncharacterized protein